MCLSLSFLSLHRLMLTSGPDPALGKGGDVFWGGSARPFLPGGGGGGAAAAGGWSASIALPKGFGLAPLSCGFFKKEPEWFQAVIFFLLGTSLWAGFGLQLSLFV